MKYINLFLLYGLIVICIQTACENQDRPLSDSIKSIPIEIEKFSSGDQLKIEDLALVSLSSKEEYLFEEIGKVLFSDELIFVKPWHQEKILVFSQSGEGMFIIDHVGKGEGEYGSISDFDIDTINKQIIIIDPGNRKVLMYSFEGKFIRDLQLNEHIKLFKIIYCQDSTVQYAVDVGYSKLNADLSSSYSFLLLDHEFNVLKRYFRFDVPRSGFNGELSKIFSHNTIVSGYYKCFTDTIYYVHCEAIVPQYLLNYNHPVIDYSDFESLMSGPADLKNSDFVMDITYFESQKYLIIVYAYKLEKYMYMYDKQNDIGHNYKIDSKAKCSARNRFPLVTLYHNSLVFEIIPRDPACLDVFDDVPGTKDIMEQLKSMDENQNPSLLIVSLAN